MLWTEALSDKITLLWETQSATEIASTLGVEDKIYVTRNAVVGKLHRLKLTINNKKVVRKGGPRITRTPEQRRSAKLSYQRTYNLKRPEILASKNPIPEPQPMYYAEKNVQGVAALEAHHCRFILNSDTSAPVYCGNQILPDTGQSWCWHHHRICHGHGTYAEQRAAAE